MSRLLSVKKGKAVKYLKWVLREKHSIPNIQIKRDDKSADYVRGRREKNIFYIGDITNHTTEKKENNIVVKSLENQNLELKKGQHKVLEMIYIESERRAMTEAIESVKNKPKKNSVKRNANSRKMSDAVPTTKVR